MKDATRKPRILIADDHTLFAEGVRSLLEPEFQIAGIVEDGRTLINAVDSLKPDVVILDISMPLLNGLDAGRLLKKGRPRLKLVYVSVHDDPEYVTEAFRIGASAYVLKRSAGAELFNAIREAVNGRTYITPLVTREMLESLLDRPKGAHENLTLRQREVLQLVAEGRTLKEIAAILNVSVKTVEFHKTRIRKELGIGSRSGLTRYAIRHRLIPKPVIES